MSEDEFHHGKVVEVVFPKEMTFSDKVFRLEKYGYKITDVDLEVESFECDELVYLPESKRVFDLIEHHQNSGYSCEGRKEPEVGYIEFSAVFNNGGCGIEEAIEECIVDAEMKAIRELYES